jgi:hypothetical protein
MSFMKKFDDALSFVDKAVGKVDNLVDRIPEGIQRAHDEIIGSWNMMHIWCYYTE